MVFAEKLGLPKSRYTYCRGDGRSAVAYVTPPQLVVTQVGFTVFEKWLLLCCNRIL